MASRSDRRARSDQPAGGRWSINASATSAPSFLTSPSCSARRCASLTATMRSPRTDVKWIRGCRDGPVARGPCERSVDGRCETESCGSSQLGGWSDQGVAVGPLLRDSGEDVLGDDPPGVAAVAEAWLALGERGHGPDVVSGWLRLVVTAMLGATPPGSPRAVAESDQAVEPQRHEQDEVHH